MNHEAIERHPVQERDELRGARPATTPLDDGSRAWKQPMTMRRSSSIRASSAASLSWTDALDHGEQEGAGGRSAPEPDLQGNLLACAAGAVVPQPAGRVVSMHAP
jgi:hypothetical protein